MAQAGGFSPPLETRAGTVLVNRGFVPPELRNSRTRSSGEPERAGHGHRPAPRQRAWRRVPAPQRPGEGPLVFPRRCGDRARPRTGERRTVLPWMQMPHSIPAATPWGGLTVIAFPNNHLVYALTWFTLAGLSVAGAALVLRGLRTALMETPLLALTRRPTSRSRPVGAGRGDRQHAPVGAASLDRGGRPAGHHPDREVRARRVPAARAHARRGGPAGPRQPCRRRLASQRPPYHRAGGAARAADRHRCPDGAALFQRRARPIPSSRCTCSRSCSARFCWRFGRLGCWSRSPASASPCCRCDVCHWPSPAA